MLGFAADIAATGFSLGPLTISFGLFGTGLAYLHRLITIKKVSQEAITIFIVGLCTGYLAWLLARIGGPVAKTRRPRRINRNVDLFGGAGAGFILAFGLADAYKKPASRTKIIRPKIPRRVLIVIYV